jgi:plasmid replication initiation protein
MSKNIVVKSNYLIEASYSLTLPEQRLILACLSKIDSRRKIDKEVTITVQDYANIMSSDINHSYEELKKAVNRLYDRSIIVSDPEQTTEIRWIQSKAIYHKGDAKVSFMWSELVLRYISQLSDRFTSYKISNIAKFTSVYSIRIYELLLQFKQTNQRIIEIEELKKWLQIEEKYEKFKEFNRKVLQKSIKEIKEKSSLDVEVSLLRKGRCVYAIQFYFADASDRCPKTIDMVSLMGD